MTAILDTVAGSDFVRRAELPDEVDRYIRQSSLSGISHVNNKSLPMAKSVELRVKLGICLGNVEIIFCQSLAAPIILYADFCDSFVETIRPSKKLVELVDGSVMLIVR